MSVGSTFSSIYMSWWLSFLIALLQTGPTLHSAVCGIICPLNQWESVIYILRPPLHNYFVLLCPCGYEWPLSVQVHLKIYHVNKTQNLIKKKSGGKFVFYHSSLGKSPCPTPLTCRWNWYLGNSMINYAMLPISIISLNLASAPEADSLVDKDTESWAFQ